MGCPDFVPLFHHSYSYRAFILSLQVRTSLTEEKAMDSCYISVFSYILCKRTSFLRKPHAQVKLYLFTIRGLTRKFSPLSILVT